MNNWFPGEPSERAWSRDLRQGATVTATNVVVNPVTLDKEDSASLGETIRSTGRIPMSLLQLNAPDRIGAKATSDRAQKRLASVFTGHALAMEAKMSKRAIKSMSAESDDYRPLDAGASDLRIKTMHVTKTRADVAGEVSFWALDAYRQENGRRWEFGRPVNRASFTATLSWTGSRWLVSDLAYDIMPGEVG